MKKYVYSFGGGTADGDGKMKDTLGGKGAGLAEMSRSGVPVPPGRQVVQPGHLVQESLVLGHQRIEGRGEGRRPPGHQAVEALDGLLPGEMAREPLPQFLEDHPQFRQVLRLREAIGQAVQLGVLLVDGRAGRESVRTA